MAYQPRRRTFRSAGLICAATFAALIGGTSRYAYASPGCHAMDLRNQPVDKYLASVKNGLSGYLSQYPWAGFSKGDKIVVSVTTLLMYGVSYGSIGLLAFTNFPTGNVLVQPSYRSFTYVVPADTSDKFGLYFRDVDGRDDAGHVTIPQFSIKCTDAGVK